MPPVSQAKPMWMAFFVWRIRCNERPKHRLGSDNQAPLQREAGALFWQLEIVRTRIEGGLSMGSEIKYILYSENRYEYTGLYQLEKKVPSSQPPLAKAPFTLQKQPA
jgi:hypothetical protein